MDIADYERRRSSRHQVKLDAHYTSVAIGVRGRMTSLSKSGLFMFSEFPDDPGTMVALSLQLTTGAPRLTTAGRVARVSRYRPIRARESNLPISCGSAVNA